MSAWNHLIGSTKIIPPSAEEPCPDCNKPEPEPEELKKIEMPLHEDIFDANYYTYSKENYEKLQELVATANKALVERDALIEALERILDNIESTPEHSTMVESKDARDEIWDIAYDCLSTIKGEE